MNRKSDPTPQVRMAVYQRDGVRCVACAAWNPLSFQHRRATGMGGSKIRPTVVDGVCACVPCNVEFERGLQIKALLRGWKVPRWVKVPALVPVFYPLFGGWHVLGQDGTRVPVSVKVALDMMRDVYGDEYEKWEKVA